MAERIPALFRKSAEGAVASYNYTDVDDGTGIVVYYGFNHHSDAADGYALTKTALYSNDIYTAVTCDKTGYEKEGDYDFDVEFNTPKRIKGKARFTYTIGAGSTAGNRRTESYTIVKVRKWDGTTETEIADAQSENVDGTTSTAREYKTLNVEVNISTLQHFKKGDTLRITIELWGKSSDSNGQIVFAHDPKDRVTDLPGSGSGTAPNTALFEAHIPYVLDL